MLVKGLIRPFVVPAVFIVILFLTLYRWHLAPVPSRDSSSVSPPPQASEPASPPPPQESPEASPPSQQKSDALSPLSQQASELPKHVGHPNSGYTEGAHREIFSVSTSDRKYFNIDFSPRRGVNPNAIPHPTLEDHWIIVGQLDDHKLDITVWLAELVCTATFTNGALSCVEPPLILSIGKTPVRTYPSPRKT